MEGKTQIVYHKAQIKGKVSPQQLMDSILVASRMQTEMYINKMSRGSALTTDEVTALKDMANIAKIKIEETDMLVIDQPTEIEQRNTLRSAVFNMLNKQSSDQCTASQSEN